MFLQRGTTNWRDATGMCDSSVSHAGDPKSLVCVLSLERTHWLFLQPSLLCRTSEAPGVVLDLLPVLCPVVLHEHHIAWFQNVQGFRGWNWMCSFDLFHLKRRKKNHWTTMSLCSTLPVGNLSTHLLHIQTRFRQHGCCSHGVNSRRQW